MLELNTLSPGRSFKFTTGDRVRKPLGYKFEGIVLAAFHTACTAHTPGGDDRYAVQNADGLIHIFNAGQLELDYNPVGVK